MRIPIVKITKENVKSFLLSLLENHWQPDTIHQNCGGLIVQQPVIADVNGLQIIVDSVVCQKCGEIGMKCALFKGKNACMCQEKDYARYKKAMITFLKTNKSTKDLQKAKKEGEMPLLRILEMVKSEYETKT